MTEADDPGTGAGATEERYRRALRAELERRFAELAAASDHAFGPMGLGDAVLVCILFLLAPALAIWIFR
jgi:hypothetical protein